MRESWLAASQPAILPDMSNCKSAMNCSTLKFICSNFVLTLLKLSERSVWQAGWLAD
jgi:hypothetical protein